MCEASTFDLLFISRCTDDPKLDPGDQSDTHSVKSIENNHNVASATPPIIVGIASGSHKSPPRSFTKIATNKVKKVSLT